MLYGEIRDPVTILLEPLAGIEDGFMLGHGNDDVIAPAAMSFGDAFDRQVVALSGARSEHDFVVLRANQGCDLCPGGLNRLVGSPSKGVATAGGIAECIGQVGKHFLEHPRIDRGG